MKLLSVLGFSLWLMMGVISAKGIGDIVVGDCLTFADMGELLEVHDKDLYLGGECDVDYLLEDKILESNVCSDSLETGTWSREMIEHGKWGFWFPSAVPCHESVEKFDLENYYVTRFDPLVPGEDGELVLPACVDSEYYTSLIQIESMRTKRWDVGQGEMYLPNPLKVHKEFYQANADKIVEAGDCLDRTLTIDYRGWGKFRSHWEEFTCGAKLPRICRKMKMKESENDAGETCIEVTEIEICPEE